MPDQSRPLNSVDAVKRWYADKLESYAGAVTLFFGLEAVIYGVDQLHWSATLVTALKAWLARRPGPASAAPGIY